jgi:hypothetical protein
MGKRFFLVLNGMILLALVVPAIADESRCAGALIVPSKQVASDIYRAIAQGRGDKIRRSNDVVAEDDGDFWEVSQYPRHLSRERSQNGTDYVTVVAGGGTLQLRITKCNGAIAEANYAR